jgi:hypothetical protein
VHAGRHLAARHFGRSCGRPFPYSFLLSLLQTSAAATNRTTPPPLSRLVCSVFFPTATRNRARRRAPFAKIRSAHFIPFQFLWSVAPPPPSPAPRPNPVRFPTSLRQVRLRPEPLLTGAARNRTCRRQLLSLGLRPVQVYESLPHGLLVLVRISFARVRRPFAGNAGAPPRPPHPLVDGQIPQLLS